MAATKLTPEQTHALFDILTHYEVYAEVESFKCPDTVERFGTPFTRTNAQPALGSQDQESELPILHTMMDKWILSLPWIKGLSSKFWSLRVQGVLRSLGEANLSESYDKGVMGSRKTLATAASSVMEALSRGMLGGCPRTTDSANMKTQYDRTNATDLIQSWEDVVQNLVYGNLFDELIELLRNTEDVGSHSPRVAAAIDYIILQYVAKRFQIFSDPF
jgi:hypothetical protein